MSSPNYLPNDKIPDLLTKNKPIVPFSSNQLELLFHRVDLSKEMYGVDIVYIDSKLNNAWTKFS